MNWRKAILYITIIGMESCWLGALLILLNDGVINSRLSVLGLWLLHPLAFVFNYLWQRLRWANIHIYPASTLVMAIALLLTIKIQLYGGVGLFNPAWLSAIPQAFLQIFQAVEPEIIVIGGGGVLWWLGWRLSRLNVTFASVITEFQFGLIILVVISLIASRFELQLSSIARLGLAFFFFSLAGMALAHSEEGPGWLAGRQRGLWSGFLLAIIGFVLTLGLVISSVITADLLHLILVPLKWIWGMVLKIMGLLASLFPQMEPAELPPELVIPAEPGPGEYGLWSMPESLRNNLSIGWTILVGGLLLAALWQVSSQFFGWLRRLLATTAGAEVEPLPGAFKADLLGLFKRIGLWLLRLRLPFRKRTGLEDVLPEAASVRQIYRHLLRWVAAKGWPRTASQTPYEYLDTLERLLPLSRDNLHFITKQYVNARYGPTLPTEPELRSLKESWHQVRQSRFESAGS